MEEEGSVQQGTQKAEKVTGYMNLLQTLDDDDIFEDQEGPNLNIKIDQSVKIESHAGKQQEFYQKFLQHDNPPDLNEMKNHLKETDFAWQKWKFSVQMKVAIFKETEIEEKHPFLTAEIGLIHIAIMKRDIEQVKFLMDLALEQGETNLDDLLKQEIECAPPQGNKFISKCAWISGTTAIHLATCWHQESLAYFLEICPHLRDIKTNTQDDQIDQFTPLHVAAAIDDDTTAATLLINSNVDDGKIDVEATNSIGQTPLHVAAQCGSIKNVMILLFDGDSSVLAEDDNGKTPLHVAKTDKILEVLLNKANINDLAKLSGDDCLFGHILRRHPKCIETYLDLMVSSKNEDAKVKERQYTFHLDTFNHDTERKSNYLDKHKKLIAAGYPEHLRHPVMKFFAAMKWQPHRKRYLFNFLVFFSFLIALTVHGTNQIDYLQGNEKCHNIMNQLWKVDANNVLISKNTDWNRTDLTIIGNTIKNGTNTLDVINTEGTLLKIESVAESKLDKSQEWKRGESNAKGFFTLTDKGTAKVLTAVAATNLDHPTVAPNGLDIIDAFEITPEELSLCDGEWSNYWKISKYAALGTLCLLTLWELMQLTTKIVNGQFQEFFGWQNMIEGVMISLTFTFYLVEHLEYDHTQNHVLKSGAQEHLLGWALFLAWLDFTMFLGRFDLFGRHIYRSFHVMKNVAWSMLVYLPSLIAFALAFHCFLDNDPIFEGPTASIIKTVAMLLGEFNYEGRFLYDYVEDVNGSQFSVQVLYVLFIIYGSVIVMNLITAWIVVNQRDANSEIILAEQQIEEITGSTEVTNCCGSEAEGNNVPPKLSVKPVHNKEENCCMSFIRRQYRNLMKGLFDPQLLNLDIFWVIKDKEEKHRLPYVPLEIIELTIDRLTAKKENKLKLMESIKEVLEEAKKNMERYTLEE